MVAFTKLFSKSANGIDACMSACGILGAGGIDAWRECMSNLLFTLTNFQDLFFFF